MISSLMIGLALVAGAPEIKEGAKDSIIGVWKGEKQTRGGKERELTGDPEGDHPQISANGAKRLE